MKAAPKSDDSVRSYLAKLEPAQRAALERLRKAVMATVPGASEGMSYGMPALKLDGHGIAGFAAFKNHLSYFPMSGTVLPEFKEDLAGYAWDKGTLRFTLEKPLPIALVKRLVRARVAELRGWKGR